MAGTRTRDWAEVDFYAILGLSLGAGDDEIGRAFRKLAKQLHPDSGASPRDAERFKDVTAAYEVLSDPSMRRDYDLVRQQLLYRPPPASPRPPVTQRTGAFRAAKPPRGWTRGRAWMALVSGVLVTLAGIGVAIVVWEFRMHSGDPNVQPDPARDVTLAIVSLKLLISGPVFVVLGARHRSGSGAAPRARVYRPSQA